MFGLSANMSDSDRQRLVVTQLHIRALQSSVGVLIERKSCCRPINRNRRTRDGRI